MFISTYYFELTIRGFHGFIGIAIARALGKFLLVDYPMTSKIAI